MKDFIYLTIIFLVICITTWNMFKKPYQLMKTDSVVCQLVDVRTVYSGASTDKQFYVTQRCISDEINDSQTFKDNIILSNTGSY